ncbi:MAG: MgtC/SapB family protein [Hungatella sp.]|jgi:putative Mg2+ transporter-C (MgtC) family protein|nr:MgtC/SapB family protein [Hungatella sp.]
MNFVTQLILALEPDLLLTTLFRLLLAAGCGGVIGMERRKRNRPAGLRTHMLVCIASALVMLTNEQITAGASSGDPTRLAAQVISGIGFLGAGTILIDRRNHVRGLTTAAGLWADACLGIAIGAGYYSGALITCILIMLIVTKFIDIEKRFLRKSRFMEIHVVFDCDDSLKGFLEVITGKQYAVHDIEVIDTLLEPNVNGKRLTKVNMVIQVPKKISHLEILEQLGESKGVCFIDEI